MFIVMSTIISKHKFQYSINFTRENIQYIELSKDSKLTIKEKVGDQIRKILLLDIFIYLVINLNVGNIEQIGRL